MGISQKLGQVAGQVQDGVKNTSVSLVGLALKIMTSFLVGLTIALIGQEMMAYGNFSFIFVMTVVFALIFKLIAKWSVGSVLLFDLFLVLISLLLRLYIQVAP